MLDIVNERGFLLRQFGNNHHLLTSVRIITHNREDFKQNGLTYVRFRSKNKNTAVKLCRFNKKSKTYLEREHMKLNYDRLESLIKESGKSKAYLCAKVNRGRYYMRDLKNANTNVPEETVEIWANELGTTPEYLTGESDEKEKTVSARAELNKLIDGMGRDELIDFIAKATEKLREQK